MLTNNNNDTDDDKCYKRKMYQVLVQRANELRDPFWTDETRRLFSYQRILLVASREGLLDVVKSLVSSGIDVDYSTYFRFTPLHAACFNGHLEVVKVLVSAGADVNKLTDNLEGALFFAARNGHLEVVKYMILSGADPHRPDLTGCTPIFSASRSGFFDVVDCLISFGAKIDCCPQKSRFSPILAASGHGHIELVKYLLSRGANPNCIDELSERSPLHDASRKGHLEIVKCLLLAGADHLVRECYGRTPLDEAANEEIAQLLAQDSWWLRRRHFILFLATQRYLPVCAAGSHDHDDSLPENRCGSVHEVFFSEDLYRSIAQYL